MGEGVEQEEGAEAGLLGSEYVHCHLSSAHYGLVPSTDEVFLHRETLGTAYVEAVFRLAGLLASLDCKLNSLDPNNFPEPKV